MVADCLTQFHPLLCTNGDLLVKVVNCQTDFNPSFVAAGQLWARCAREVHLLAHV